jgi:hypothetical protein
MKPVRIVCGTRATQQEFLSRSALGRSLVIHREANPVDVLLFTENRNGLSSIYNDAIEKAKDSPAILVFIHDDVHLLDFHWTDAVRAGVEAFDVIGVAGNKLRVPRQPSWAFVNDELVWDERANLSGLVAHGNGFPNQISHFGPSKQACKLLDGMLLAADSERLHASGLRFDDQFDFHFYDIDFCRQAEQRNMSIGTWPISVVHESAGAFNSPGWRAGLTRYRGKYAD